MTAPAQWTPPTPAPVPADGWNNNHVAVRARTSFLWAIGILVGSWITAVVLAFAPSSPAQAIGVLVSWAGFLTATVLAILAIVFGGIGVSRAGKLGGHRRGTALIGLLGGIGVLAIGPAVVLVGSFALLAWS